MNYEHPSKDSLQRSMEASHGMHVVGACSSEIFVGSGYEEVLANHDRRTVEVDGLYGSTLVEHMIQS